MMKDDLILESMTSDIQQQLLKVSQIKSGNNIFYHMLIHSTVI